MQACILYSWNRKNFSTYTSYLINKRGSWVILALSNRRLSPTPSICSRQQREYDKYTQTKVLLLPCSRILCLTIDNIAELLYYLWSHSELVWRLWVGAEIASCGLGMMLVMNEYTLLFPDWLQLTGLIHDVGKLLALWGEPQWAAVGDTFPVGCAFSEKCVFHNFFEKNPDNSHPVYRFVFT